MAALAKKQKTCPFGHTYFKSSDCPTCPICEAKHKPAAEFMSHLAAPARRALENAGLTSLELLSQQSEAEVLKLHGMGKRALLQLNEMLNAAGWQFRNDSKRVPGEGYL